jgi:hypothetical protein
MEYYTKKTQTHLQARPSHNTLPHAHDRCKFAQEAAIAADYNAKICELVDLNIGGERYVTVPCMTLTQVEDSMLAAMFSGRRMYINKRTESFFKKTPHCCTSNSSMNRSSFGDDRYYSIANCSSKI